MAEGYWGTRISPHKVKQSDGSLICLGAKIARTGTQPYKVCEVDPSSGDESIVEVLRPVSEVTNPTTLASFEGVPVVGPGHPAKFVTPDTYSWTARGHAQNVRIGPTDDEGNVTVLADLFVRDKSLIDAIERGLRDLSCGYTYSLVQLSDGTWAQTNIRGNHIAVVESGRAGTAQIQDSMEDNVDGKKVDEVIGLLKQVVQQLLKKNGEADDSDDDGDLNEEYKRGARKDETLNGEVVSSPNQGGEPINPVRARDALTHLRKLRPFIEANGDREGIDGYNRALRILKAQAAQAERFNPRTSAYDSRSRSSRSGDATAFEASASRFHRQPLKVHGEMLTNERSAADSEQPVESFEDAVKRARDEMQEKWAPKHR